MAYLSNENAIPLMTSNTTPSGFVSASSSWSANNEFHAFTNSTSDWRTQTGYVAGWIRYDFPRKICISKYTIVPGSTITANPKLWTFEGSDDGINWTILDSKGNQTSWSSSADYTIPNRVSFSKYRLNISENNGYSTHTNIRQLMMYEYVYEQKYLISSAGSYHSIKMSNIHKNVITPMTSHSSSAGIVSSSNTTTSAWTAFNGSKIDNGWLIDLRNEPKTQWLSYKFPTPKVIGKYTISYVFTATTDAAPKSWTFEGSNNGTDWVVLDTRASETNWYQYQTREYIFQNQTAYLYYRIYVSDNNGGLYQIFISEIEMMETTSEIISIGAQGSEGDFLKYGMNKEAIIDLERTVSTKSIVNRASTSLGSGKVFKETIDTSMIPIKSLKIV